MAHKACPPRQQRAPPLPTTTLMQPAPSLACAERSGRSSGARWRAASATRHPTTGAGQRASWAALTLWLSPSALKVADHRLALASLHSRPRGCGLTASHSRPHAYGLTLAGSALSASRSQPPNYGLACGLAVSRYDLTVTASRSRSRGHDLALTSSRSWPHAHGLTLSCSRPRTYAASRARGPSH